MKGAILKYGFLHALASAAYVTVIVAFMTNAEKILGPKQEYLGGVLFLLVFVISAAAMAMLVFGRPVMWYMDGAKREAVSLAITIVGFLIATALIVFFVLVSGIVAQPLVSPQ